MRSQFSSSTRQGLARLRLAVLLLAIACAGCSKSDPAAPEAPAAPLVTEVVDDQGGRVVVPGTGLMLDIPAGALAAPTTITVSKAAVSPPGVVGDAYDFGPDGTSFAQPVSLTFDYAPLGAGLLPDDLRLVTFDSAAWIEVETATLAASRSDAGGTLQADLEHFSIYAVLVVPQAQLLRGSFGYAPNHAYAFGTDAAGGGLVARWDGTTVTPVLTTPGVRYIDGWGRSPTEQYCLSFDTQGHVRSSTDGASWTVETSSDQSLTSLSGNASQLVAVGYAQRILENTGSGWADASFPDVGGTPARQRVLRGVHVFASGEALAVGDEIALHRDNAGTWTEHDLGSVFATRFSLRSVWGRSPMQTWAVGWELVPGQSNRGVVLSYDGTWQRETLPGSYAGFRGVWGDDDEVYVVGNSGTVLKKTVFWNLENSGTTATLYDAWAMSDTAFVFVGAGGTVVTNGTAGGGGGPVNDLVIDLTEAPVEGCHAPWTDQGVTLVVGNTTPEDTPFCPMQFCETYPIFGTSVWLICGRLSLDLSALPGTLVRAEIDIQEGCNDAPCSRAYLYSENGTVDTAGSVLQQSFTPQTLELQGNGSRIVGLAFASGYGGAYQIRLEFEPQP